MTTRPYHHGNLREALVEAGIDLARAEGPSGVVLRAVTRAVGVSPNAAYRHFADREALLGEIAARGMVGLVRSMQTRVDEVTETDPVLRARLRLRAIGLGYVDFALAEPGMFRVAFAAPPELAPAPVPGEPAHAGDPFGMLNAVLDELVEAGYLPAEHRPGAEVLCWSMVHGFSVLHLDGPLVGTPPDEREAALAAALDRVDGGLGARD